MHRADHPSGAADWSQMNEPHDGRPGVRPPTLPAPPPFVERRTRFRREADRLAHRETVLLARALDILAGGSSAEERLTGVLRLLAATVDARRAAVVAGGVARRVVVDGGAGTREAAERFGAWLDAEAPRSRAARAATGRAPVAVVGAETAARRSNSSAGTTTDTSDGAPAQPGWYACVPAKGAGDVALGFEFDEKTTSDDLKRRLPPQLARHAAVALALVTRELAAESELEELRAREAERTRFVSTVAHELRTPLTGLAGYLDLILDGKVDDPTVERDFLERSQGIVDSMNELVGDLLELSRLESGTLGLVLAPFSVAEVGTRVVERLEPLALRRGIRLTTTLPPRLRSATGDRRRVEQVLTNLVGNSLKFAATGSEVEIRGWFDGPVALLAVRDEGAGIAPDDRRRIFDRFFRVSGHEPVTGTGLGLPIARELAREMDGELDVASVPGSGSSFVLALPGPTPLQSDEVAAVMARALAVEEIRLEEAAVLRALRDAGRALPRPHVVTSPTVPGADAEDSDGGADRLTGPGSSAGAAHGVRPVRLHAIDGLAPRRADPAPA
jgi:signal transduction histidine kinase